MDAAGTAYLINGMLIKELKKKLLEEAWSQAKIQSFTVFGCPTYRTRAEGEVEMGYPAKRNYLCGLQQNQELSFTRPKNHENYV